jgi:sortase A
MNLTHECDLDRAMNRQRIAIGALATLGTGLLLLAFVLGSQAIMNEKWLAEQEQLYLAHEWLPEPTIAPATSTAPATPTPTPAPTPTPQPQPPTRLIIPRIKVNSAITQMDAVVEGDPLDPTVTWPKLSRGIGHDRASANPGESGNIILFGHNNTAGQVFRHLSQLSAGDLVYVYTSDQEFSYAVQDVDIVPVTMANDQDRELHAFYLGPKTEETLTLVSCWPYTTYTHRVYVIARPVGVSDQ